MNGSGRAAILFLLVCYFHSGCSSSAPAPEIRTESAYSGSGQHFVDWDAESWKFVYPFPPRIFPVTARYNNLKYTSPYQQFTHFDQQFESLNLEEFLQLPPATQKRRRKAAAESLQEAMTFDRIMAWSWEIWQQSLRSQVAKETWFYQYGIVTPAIMNLEKAASEDPGNPYVWSHLAFFTGLVGNANRQMRALENGMAALDYHQQRFPDLSEKKQKENHLMRLRMLLDYSWCLRDKGRFNTAMNTIDETLEMMNRDKYRTHDLGREALLLKALLLVEQGRLSEARTMANNFKTWQVPVFEYSEGYSPPATKYNLPQVQSDFSRQWVWDFSHMKAGNRKRALRPPGFQAAHLLYPAHLGYRFWQDMGRIREHFGERSKATTFYLKGYMCRPFLSFFPTRITTGVSPIFGQTDTGSFHFLGYLEFFVGGSDFAFAANKVARMERAFSKKRLEQFGYEAIDALTACFARGIRPGSSLALRGYAHTLLDQPELAEQDFRESARIFAEEGHEDAHLIRMLATVLYNRKEYQKSHSQLERFLEIEPQNSAAWRLDGVILAEMERYPESLAALNKSLKIEPTSTSGLYNRALVRLHLGQLKAARLDLKKADELSPDNPEITRLAKLLKKDPSVKIKMQHQNQRWNLILPEFSENEIINKAAGLDQPQLEKLMTSLQDDYCTTPNQETRLDLAFAFREGRQWDQLQKLLEPLWPDKISNQETLLLLEADRANGQPRRAMELAESLSRELSVVGDKNIWTLVAVICHENGKTTEGNRALDLALQLDPENRALQMMRARKSY